MIENDILKIVNIMERLGPKPEEIHDIDREISLFPDINGLKYRKRSLSNHYSLGKLNGYIVDFEGEVFMAGFLTGNGIHQFYITEESSTPVLYKRIIDFFALLQKKNFIGFCFSDFEIQQLKKINLKIKVSSKNILENLFLINLQKERFESLVEATLQMGLRNTGDILNRDSNNIVNFYRYGLIEPILLHNQNCLTLEAMLLKKRFIKNHKI